MKYSVLLAALLAFSLTACGKKEEAPAPEMAAPAPEMAAPEMAAPAPEMAPPEMAAPADTAAPAAPAH